MTEGGKNACSRSITAALSGSSGLQHSSRPDQRGMDVKRSTIVFFWSHETSLVIWLGKTAPAIKWVVLVKSWKMTVRTQTLPWSQREEGVKAAENKIHCPRRSRYICKMSQVTWFWTSRRVPDPESTKRRKLKTWTKRVIRILRFIKATGWSWFPSDE